MYLWFVGVVDMLEFNGDSIEYKIISLIYECLILAAIMTAHKQHQNTQLSLSTKRYFVIRRLAESAKCMLANIRVIQFEIQREFSN